MIEFLTELGNPVGSGRGVSRFDFKRCLAAVVASCLVAASGSVSAAPFQLNWDAQTWAPEGNLNLSQSLPVGNHNIIVTVGGNTDALDNDDGGDGSSPISPAINSWNTGGLVPVQNSFYIGVDHPDQTDKIITVTLDFSQYPGGVSGVDFTAFDIDMSSSFTDRLTVVAQTTAGPVNPSQRFTSAANQTQGANAIQGNASSGRTSPNGNARYVFNQSGITQIVLTYSNENLLTDPGFQFYQLHDINFNAPVADAQIIKTASTLAPLVGTDITFTLTASNNGPDAAPSVTVNDLLPAGYTYVSDTSAGTYNPGTGVWDVGALASGASATIDIVATVNGTGPYTNTAIVSVTGVDDNDPSNNTSSVTPVPVAQADLSLTKTVDNAEPAIGSNVVYTVVTSNAGPSTATGVTVLDQLPSGLSFVSASATVGSYVSASGVWTIGSLAAGTDATLTLTATVLPTGTYNNTAQVNTANEPDPNSTPGNNVPAEDDQDNAPLLPAQIGTTKQVTAGPTSNGDGSFDVTYRIGVTNTGSATLNSVQVSDSLATTFSAATGFSVESLISIDFAVNAGYNGNGNNNLLSGSDSLAAGASGAVTLVVRVTPGATLGPYDNSATASGSSPGGTPVSDVSNDSADPDPDGNGNPGDNNTPTPVTFVEAPQIGVAKTISAGPVNNGDGSFTLTYALRIENTGDVALSGVQVSDALATTFAGATFVAAVPTSADFAVNPAYNGNGNNNLLAGTNTLAIGAFGTVSVAVTVTPGATLGPYDNSATGSGTSPGGVSVNDTSTDGTNVDPDGDGNPGNNSTPTPVTFVEMPQIGAAKDVTAGPTNNGDGTFDLTYTILVENTGDVLLSSLQVVDDLAATFSGAISVSSVSATSGTLNINPGYNGIGNNNLLTGADTLAVGASATIVVSATVTPGANLGPYDNSATASGVSPANTLVSDLSTDGANVDPDGNGDPGNNSTPTPITFVEMPQIGTAKRVSAGPVNNGDGSFSFSYTMLLENTGDVPLSGVQMVDNLSATFPAVPFVVDSLTSTDFATNPGFNGAADTNLLSGTDLLAVGASGTVVLSLTVTPGTSPLIADNSAIGSGTSPAGTDVDDISTDGSNVDPDGNGDPGDNSTPTPIIIESAPSLGVAKDVVSGPVNNGDGSYTFVYSVRIENTGDIVLNNVQATDVLSTTFSGATFTVAAPTSATFAVNALYNGNGNNNLMAGTNTLAVGAFGSVEFAVTVTPGGNLGPYNNLATGTATAPSGANVSDVSTDGVDVDPDGDGNPGNNSVPTPVSFVEMPQIGAAKDITSGPTNNGDGTYGLTYTIQVANTGDVPLSGVQVVENLAATFSGATVTGVAAASGTFTINAGYNGIGNTNLLTGGDTLAVGASGTITVSLTVEPGASPGPYNNTATANGTSPAGTNVSDVSTDGVDVDPDGDGDPGNNSTPTPVTFVEMPQIGTAKDVTAGPTNNGDGSYTLSYSVRLENTGDVELSSVQIIDDLTATFGATPFTVVTTSSADFTVNAGYNGGTNPNLLSGGDTLAVAASGTIDVTVQVTPGATLGPFDNSAVGAGTSPAGTTVNDVSTDGTNVDPDGDGDPGNNSVPTPVTFAEAPLIGIAKALTGAPTSNGDGSFTFSYDMLVRNAGDVPLSAVQVSDDLATTFAAADAFQVDNVSSADFAVNVGFDGDGDQNILAGSDSLAVGAQGSVTIIVTVTPGADLGPYNNTAVAAGTSPAGTGVNDNSTDGVDPDPDGNGDPTDNSVPTPVSFIEMPQLGVAKAIVTTPVNDGFGNFTFTYRLLVDNTGDVDLENLQVTDDLAAAFMAPVTFAGVIASSADFAVNALYDGSTDLDLLAGTDTLAPGSSGIIDITLTVSPGGNFGPFNNSAIGSGTSPGGAPVTDTSTAGANVDPDGDGDPGNNSVPTPVSFNEAPQIGAAKALTTGPTSNGDGTFTLTYTVLVENTGDVALSNVQVVENFDVTFASAAGFEFVSVSSVDFATNAGFDGSTDTNMLAGTDSLALAASGTVDVTLTVTPGADLGPYNNNATAIGISPAGTPVSDVSTLGANVDPDGNGDPGNDSIPTPVTFIEAPQIGIAKALSGPPVNNGDGSYTLAYNLLIENTGDVDLNSLQVSDDLATTFAGATSFSVISTVSADFALDVNFDGGASPDLLVGTGTLAAGATGNVTINLSVVPGATLGPYDNLATASGLSPGGAPVSDISTDGVNVDPDGNGNPGDNMVPTPVTFAQMPQIGLAKAVTAGPTPNNDGTATLTYTLLVANTGDVVLDNLQLSDDLGVTFGAAVAYNVVGFSSTDFTLDPLFDGAAQPNLFAAGNMLATGASGVVTIDVQVTPGANLGPYNNSATISGDSPSGAPVTDISTDGNNVDPDGNGNPGDNSTPTPVTFAEMPVIGIAKTVSTTPVANGDGSFTLAYTLTVENLGDVVLNSVQVSDSLATTFAGAGLGAIALSSADFTTSGSYNGDLDTSLLAGTDTLAIGATGTIDITVTVTPGANLGPYNNSATATGLSPAGTPTSDDSVDGTVPDSNGDGDPTNDTSPTPVSFVEMPQIGLAKSVSSAPVSNGDGTFTLTYTLLVDNTGDVELSALQVTDSLATTFSAAVAFSAVSASSADFTVNPAYNGAADTNLLAASDTLAAGAMGNIDVTVTVEPGALLGPYNNSATANGTSPAGASVSDISQSGANVDPDGDGNPGNNSDTTPVSFNEMPQIGAAKNVSAGPSSNGDGTFTVTYSVLIANSGDVALSAVQAVENLDVTFAAAVGYSGVSVSSADFTVNPAFDGSVTTNLLTGTDTLAIGASGTIDLTVTIELGANLGPFNNTATVTGTSPGGTPVSDDSQVGTNPDPDGDGDPGNNNDPTPINISPSPQIGLAKALTGAPVSNNDGTFTLSYDLLVENTGDVPLSGLQVTDILAATFVGATSFSVGPLTSVDFAINSAYNGGTDANLLAGSDSLAPMASGTISLTVTVEPGATLGPHDNSATATGTSPAGTNVSDVSTNGVDVDPDNDDNPGNNSTPTTVTFVEAPQIGVANQIIGLPVANGDGTFTFEYTIVVTNTGDVPLNGVQLDNDLATTFATSAGLVFNSATSTDFSVNPGYDGATDTSLFDGSDTLAPGQSGTVVVSVTVTPGANLGPYDNNATASGTSPGGTVVNDVSTDGASVDPDGDGNPGNNSVPTPVQFVEMPQIGLAKSISTGPTTNGDGSFDLTYRLLLANTGDVDVVSLQINDDLATTFGGVTSFTINSVSASGISANTGYDGSADTNLLIGTDTLAAGATATVDIALTVLPGMVLGPYTNTATATGSSIGGMPVSDVSQSGTNVDPDGDGDPGNNSEPTPVSFNENPVIGAAKTVSAGPTNNGDGSFTLAYSITIANSGDVLLANIQVLEDLGATFAGVSTISVDSLTSATLTTNVNFNGTTDTALLSGADSLALASVASVELTVTVTPGMSLGPFDNLATASGETPNGTPVSDDSTDGTDPDPEGDGPGDNNVPTTVLFDEMAQLGVANQVPVTPIDNGDGSFTYDYVVVISNSGEVVLDNVQLVNDLGVTFAAADAVVVNSVSSPDLTVNPDYDGATDTSLLTGADTLAPGAGGTVTINVTVTPGATLGPYNNNAVGSATSPSGAAVSDISTDGDNADPDGDGDPGNNSVPTAVQFPAQIGSVSGNAWLDADTDRLFDSNEMPLGGWILQVLQNGVVVATVNIAADGTYSVPDLPAGGGYSVTLRNPENNATFGVLNDLVLRAGQNLGDQNLPIDPSGVVYDSVTRDPIAGAFVQMVNSAGTLLPPVCLLSDQQDQTTGVNGMYRFDINLDSDPACLSGETFTLRVTEPPTGYLSPPSALIGPQAGALDPTGQGDPFAIAPQPGPPQGADSTIYYFSFTLATGDPDVINNHIPLDPPSGVTDVRLTKIAERRQGSIGDLIPYTIRAENVGLLAISGLTIADNIPAGFSFVQGSARLEGAGTLTVSGQRPVSFGGIDLPLGGTATVRYILRVGAGVTQGDYVNTATPLLAGTPIGTSATARVAIVSDPDIEQTTIIGMVFNDANGNGQQDAGEVGIPGVRLATVEGLLVETDAYGRYHLAGIDGGFAERGRNFIIKVDPATLPDGAQFTTENPRVQRITQGLMNNFNFGVRMADCCQRIAVKLGEVFFVQNSADVRPEFRPLLDQLAERLADHGGGKLLLEGNASCDLSGDEMAAGISESISYTLTPHFGIRKTQLSAADRAELDRIATNWAGAEIVQVRSIGHTSNVGIAKRNQHEFLNNYVLSQARAKVVADYLQQKMGLKDSQIIKAGKGPDEPVASNKTPEGRALNRRVELTIEGTRGGTVVGAQEAPRCEKGLAEERARNVLEELRRRLGDDGVSNIDMYIGDRKLEIESGGPEANRAPAVESDDMKDSPVARLLRRSAAAILSLVVSTAHAQAAEPDQCSVDSCRVGDGYAIQIIGYDEGQRPASELDTPAVLADGNRVDISGEFLVPVPGGGKMWITEDPAVVDPRMAIHSADSFAIDNGRIAQPVVFWVYKNYDAFIDRAQVEVYHDGDIDRLEPLAVLTLPQGDFVSVEWDGSGPKTFAPGDSVHYLVRAFDSAGRVDMTREKTIQAVVAADYDPQEQSPLTRRQSMSGDAQSRSNVGGTPLNGKVVVMMPEKEILKKETISYTLTPRFDSRKTVLKGPDRAELDNIIAQWNGAENIRIEAVGHTDDIRIAREHRGEFANNQVLSEARAKAVIKYIGSALNLNFSQVVATGRGPKEPVASNDSPDGRALNRRVELTISGERMVRASLRPLSVELVDAPSGQSVPVSATLEEALNILTAKTGDTTPGIGKFGSYDGRRLEVDCSVAQSKGHELQAVYGRNELVSQNIPMYGSRVRLHGQDIDGNFAMQVNDRMVPIDVNGRFAVDYMVPVGKHSYDVEFLDESCIVRSQASLPVDVSGKHMFIVGLADLTLSGSDISGSLEPLSANDRYQEDFLVEGRVAFYLKGKIRGKYLVTAQMDTKEEQLSDLLDNIDDKDPRSIFRRLDPDRYYPVYGDDSTTIADTDSIGKLYLRADWDKSRAVWGNFHTGLTSTEFAQYNRSLYGGQVDWRSLNTNVNGESRTTANVFVSENQTELGHSEFIGTGGSLYYLKHTDLLPGSDKLRVEIRDRDSERVLENITLTRGVDYELDEIQGRILLARPLMQITQRLSPTLVKDSPLDGNSAILIADYEYIPVGFSPDHVGFGGRGRHWFGDHFALGGTYVTENRGGGAADYELLGVDATLQAAPNTYIKAEYVSSDENQVQRFLSNDGGLRFNSLNNTAVPGRSGDAFSIEARVNTREWLNTQNEWVIASWYRHTDDEFSIARRDTGVDVDEYGGEIIGRVGERLTLTGRASVVDRDVERDDTRLSLQADYKLTSRSLVSGELRHVDETLGVLPNSGQVNGVNRTAQGDGTIAALRYTYLLNDRWSVYGGGQISIDQGATYDNNDLGTVGVIANINAATTFAAEFNSGHRGDGASATLEHAINDRHRIYGTYTRSTDTTETLANDQIAIGQRSIISNNLTLFNEHQFSEYRDNYAGIAHVFGLDYALDSGWNLGATFQTGDLDTGLGLVNRDAISGNIGFRGERFSFSSKLEFRSDDGTTADAEQTVSTNRFDYRYSPSTRLLGRLNYSETEDNIDPNYDAKFSEAQIGVAYRPVEMSRLNLLAKYTYLYDLRGFDQNQTNTDQRSNIWSVEGLYALSQRWEVGGKYAYRHGELRTDRSTGQWFDSTTSFVAVRGRYHLVRRWDALAEYRWLDVDEAQSTRNGFLVALDRHFGDHLKLGVGYNFTDFSDDLTNLDYDHNGWFLNAVGKY